MNTKRTSVLVVDDSDDFANMLATLIGFEPDLACVGVLDGADALAETIVAKNPDVVLLDLTMPGRDSLDALAEASGRCPACRFVVLSGYDDPEIRRDAERRGAAGFVSKASDIDEILRTVRAVSTVEVRTAASEQ